jgi:ribosomal protein S17E
LPSKRLRNMAAGYISRLVKRQNAKQRSLEA